MEYVIGLLFYVLCGVIFGLLTAKVIRDKGYKENWFWWGFFFGFIALVIAIVKPVYTQSTFSKTLQAQMNKQEKIHLNQTLLAEGGWKCTCGRINAKYVTTCPCGLNQRAVASEQSTSK